MSNYTYEEEPLAAGGEKVVHRGRCVESGDAVVVKFLRTPYSQADVNRFGVEIERARVGRPAGIARIIDANLQWVPPFLVEEYFPDGTLSERMAGAFAQHKVFVASWALGWCRQILTQLAGLHARNIIHRDVKPANVLMRGNDVVLGDLGIGRTLVRPTMLQTRAFVGTRGYAAPEQENGWAVDHRADIYAVGVVLHELLTGERGAYDRITYVEHRRVAQLLAQFLALNPSRRPRSSAAAIQLIDVLLATA